MKGCLERWASARRSLNVSSLQGGKPPDFSVQAAPSHQKSPLWTTNATSEASMSFMRFANSFSCLPSYGMSPIRAKSRLPPFISFAPWLAAQPTSRKTSADKMIFMVTPLVALDRRGEQRGHRAGIGDDHHTFQPRRVI